MLSVVKAAGATVANAALPLVYQDGDGHLKDLSAASYRILDSAETQVFPGSGAEAVDLVAHKLGTGRYAALWTPGAAAVGRYTIRWSATPTGGSAIVFDQEFELVASAYQGPNYCAVYDLRDEGLTTAQLADANAQKAIVRASRYVEFFTGRRFAPQYRVVELDGNTSRELLLDEPIVALEKIVVSYTTPFTNVSPVVDLDNVRVFNRHLTQKLAQPDDRDNPKLSYVHGQDLYGVGEPIRAFSELLVWPSGKRNVQVTGLFGYTEADDSFVGHTPDILREACKLLVFKNLTAMSKYSSFRDPARILSESTRDQSVTYSAPTNSVFTGDRNIDQILIGFRRPPTFGAA